MVCVKLRHMSKSTTNGKVVLDHYGVLQVKPNASVGVIQAAWKALMKVKHPDISDNEEAAKRLNEAHKILSDPILRKEYDKERNNYVGKQVGNYLIKSKIAEGGFGITYLGEHTITKEPVCIKHCSEISPEYEEILIEEAKAVWDLRHYSISLVRDLLKLEDGSMALIQSYISGPTLEQVIEKAGPLDPENVAWITERVLNALRYLHYEGVIHGDLKPQNIIVQPNKHMAAIIDYGLALSKPGRNAKAKGYTQFFAPPEQEAGKPIIPESDYYSLGMTMLYMLGGEDALLRKQVPVNTPDPMKEFIRSLIRKDVLQRPEYGKVDLYEEFVKVRFESFGRHRSNMKPIPGF